VFQEKLPGGDGDVADTVYGMKRSVASTVNLLLPHNYYHHLFATSIYNDKYNSTKINARDSLRRLKATKVVCYPITCSIKYRT